MYLNCHSYFSLRHGTLSVEELVAWAQSLGIRSLALTDIHNSSACYEFVRRCREADISPVVGMEFRRQDELLYVALARNLEGFREINRFYSIYQHEGVAFPELPPNWSQVYVIYPWHKRERLSLSENEYLGIRPSEVPQLFRSRYRHRQEKLVVLQPVTYRNKKGYHAHRLLRAIDHNCLLSQLKPTAHAATDELMLPPDQLRSIFADYPQILANSQQLLHNCVFDFSFQERHTKQNFTGHKYDDMVLLESLASRGLAKRYGPNHKQAQQRLERELKVIDQLDFNAYFLITWDFVRFGQSCGFHHVGRGSGANSLVAYCLGITDVDPLELDLYFERFLNPKRTSPPDFDIDYSWKDRDAVIDYVFKRYGQRHTALLATYQHFKARSVLREISKTLGIPKGEVDRLLSQPEIKAEEVDEVTRLAVRYAHYIKGFPSHLSLHAGGILIAKNPIHAYTATDMPPKGFPITHFDMYEAEAIGLHKFDILSQRGLGHIQEATELIYQNHQISINVHEPDKLKKDEKVRRLLARGRTVGCFYIESPAMRQLLQKLGCADYPTLVAASSVIRPGVARSGMMRSYIERHNGKPFQYLHPQFAEILEETYGVMVYQEDVLKVAHLFGGVSLAEADLLRRAMSGKFRTRTEFEQVKDRFFEECRKKGHPEALIEEVWRQMESFAGYSFCKAHSASYAVESYQSLYLKAHYPLEFIVAVINNFGGFYDLELYLHEARTWGGEVHAPCVNQSSSLTSLKGQHIYLGFGQVKSLRERVARAIEAEREAHGPFRDLLDFMQRVPIQLEQLILLIRVGAFAFTQRSKANLLWEARLRAPKYRARQQQETLFDTQPKDFQIPELPASAIEDAYDEMELLGFPLCSPFKLLQKPVPNSLYVRDLPQQLGQNVQLVGYLITYKTTRTVNGKLMQFINFVDATGHFLDVVSFPEQVARYPLRGRGLYLLQGKVVEEFGVFSLELSQLKKLSLQPDPRLEEAGRI
jgi:DNA-directed DNA polymerase III PolC